ncbi:hypothetical protein GF366_01120 [Candidatus Peregrinibacteria bacterium]|nr:hypothetical protein [Candidatus Peregrinibacteria bacterium]
MDDLDIYDDPEEETFQEEPTTPETTRQDITQPPWLDDEISEHGTDNNPGSIVESTRTKTRRNTGKYGVRFKTQENIDPISRGDGSRPSHAESRDPERTEGKIIIETDIDIEEIEQECQVLYQIGINIKPVTELLCTIENKEEREEIIKLFIVLLFLPRGIRLCNRDTYHNLRMIIRNNPILKSYFRDLAKFCFREREHDKKHITRSIQGIIPDVDDYRTGNLEENLQILNSLTKNSAASLVNWQKIDELIAAYRDRSA